MLSVLFKSMFNNFDCMPCMADKKFCWMNPLWPEWYH